ncbi:hypothetical protein ACFPFX_33325 [Streptomyces mauvecolor]|uniref:Uncharacterized protein n=1 Tax=Streptomyces mauvecolor TaxID=58345 RepID=A0ABV9UVG7_9ACTN
MRAVAEHDCDARKLDFCLIHAGVPRVFDDLTASWTPPPSEAFPFSRATPTEYGDIAGAVVLDSLARLFDEA